MRYCARVPPGRASESALMRAACSFSYVRRKYDARSWWRINEKKKWMARVWFSATADGSQAHEHACMEWALHGVCWTSGRRAGGGWGHKRAVDGKCAGNLHKTTTRGIWRTFLINHAWPANGWRKHTEYAVYYLPLGSHLSRQTNDR